MTVLGLCDRFKALPSQVMAEDASVLRLLKLEHHGRRTEEEGGEPYG